MIRESGVVPMLADQTDKENWVIQEFLNALGQPTIPYYPVILAGEGGKVIELPTQLSPPAVLPAAGKEKFAKALAAALAGG